jgi:hypothetical protein
MLALGHTATVTALVPSLPPAISPVARSEGAGSSLSELGVFDKGILVFPSPL